MGTTTLRILVVDDDPDVRGAVVDVLGAAEHEVTPVGDGAAALERLAAGSFDLVITDVRMPKVDGLTLFRRTLEMSPRPDVILMTSFGSVSDAVAALKQGARDYLTKPFDLDELVVRVGAIAERRGLQRQLAAARAQLAASAETEIVGESPGIRRLLERVGMVAGSDAAVLVTGETGTGKELVARRIHALSPRSAGPFVAVNCAAFPETLLEAELFGYARGAFTGATRPREGRFKAADGGTLLLDEVDEMPLPAQAKLLRVLQEGKFEPLGTNASVRVDVRIVSATHRDLRRRIAEGLFREDLFYRLNVVAVHIPPLRDRAGDLPLLVNHFLRMHLPAGAALPEVSVAAWQALTAYPFLGNVRELGHAIQHAVVLSHGGTIELEHLPDDITRLAATAGPERALKPLAQVVKQAERDHLLRALAVAGGKRVRAAELLGISRKNLWEKLRAHGLSDSDVDDGND
jgi:DNA-binding NtrC family response regulator